MNENTKIADLTISEFKALLRGEESTPQTPEPEKQYLYGIGGLASYLNCSSVTAQKIKSSGKVPYIQHGRKIVFDVEEVKKALKK